VANIPDQGQVIKRYYRYYANRTRGKRCKAAQAAEPADTAPGDGASGDPELALGEVTDVTVVEPADFSRSDARRRWGELIRLIYAADPLVCAKCGGAMRLISSLSPGTSAAGQVLAQ
jgi:hypothetical protein